MDATFQQRLTTGLVWLPEHGMGWYPVDQDAGVYDTGYMAKYQEYAKTAMGRALTDYRKHFVTQLHLGRVLDIGIGAGSFVEAMPDARGYDVNPAARAWLEERGLWADPYATHPDAVTMWDVLEHIPEPRLLLDRVRRWVFVSLPIFTGPDHVLRSRHYRRDEHCWYWTRRGLIDWMEAQGLTCVQHSTNESLLGREDIHTFAFRRTRPWDRS